jgi:hypothetical protein
METREKSPAAEKHRPAPRLLGRILVALKADTDILCPSMATSTP